jgi:hypothetical protein
MDSTAFSLLGSSNSEVDGNQEIELSIGSLNILIGPSGSSRLSDLTKSDPSASNPKIEEILESSEGSSSKANSPVILEKTSIAGGDEIEEIFKLEGEEHQPCREDFSTGSNGVLKAQRPRIIISEEEERNNIRSSKEVDNSVETSELEDLLICLDDTSDNSVETWKTGLELSEDNNSIFSSFNSNVSRKHQVLVIIGDNSEEVDENNNPVINPANVNRGSNHLAEGETAESLATREKIRLSANEWEIIREAVQHGTPIPADSSKDMLFGYHYALRQQAKRLAREKSEIQKRKESAIAASDAARKARSDASYSNARRNRRHGSRYDNLKYSDRQSISKNLESSTERKYSTKNSRGSTSSSTSIPTHNKTKSRRP